MRQGAPRDMISDVLVHFDWDARIEEMQAPDLKFAKSVRLQVPLDARKRTVLNTCFLQKDTDATKTSFFQAGLVSYIWEQNWPQNRLKKGLGESVGKVTRLSGSGWSRSQCSNCCRLSALAPLPTPRSESYPLPQHSTPHIINPVPCTLYPIP